MDLAGCGPRGAARNEPNVSQQLTLSDLTNSNTCDATRLDTNECYAAVCRYACGIGVIERKRYLSNHHSTISMIILNILTYMTLD